ncbi:MAG TPA: hypothetical protein VMG10_17230 [Gemmataceae bacterium]|nr:hypothetical protein [Gemmataceae bacterium]
MSLTDTLKRHALCIDLFLYVACGTRIDRPYILVRQLSSKEKVYTEGARLGVLLSIRKNYRLFEGTRDKELVREYDCPLTSASPGQRSEGHAIHFARQYGSDKLTFTKEVVRAHP